MKKLLGNTVLSTIKKDKQQHQYREAQKNLVTAQQTLKNIGNAPVDYGDRTAIKDYFQRVSSALTEVEAAKRNVEKRAAKLTSSSSSSKTKNKGSK